MTYGRESPKSGNRAYYAAHKEEFKAYHRAYRTTHKEEHKAYIGVANALRSYPNTSVSLRRNIVITKRLIKTLKGAL